MEENFELLEGYQFNLSDFALFLSVMKDPRAYRCVLSVFMDEPDIELQDVKVEQVVLNKSGKRAIHRDHLYHAGRYFWKRSGEIYVYRAV